MKRSVKIGFSFGLTSGIITTLGLMVGLHSTTNSQFVIIGGVLTIAIADAFAESMGIHISQESEHHIPIKEIWESTVCTFISKFLFSSLFIIPILLLELHAAILISIMIGLYLIIIVSIAIARERNEKPWKVVSEHLVISIFVIVLTHYVGQLISIIFK